MSKNEAIRIVAIGEKETKSYSSMYKACTDLHIDQYTLIKLILMEEPCSGWYLDFEASVSDDAIEHILTAHRFKRRGGHKYVGRKSPTAGKLDPKLVDW